MGFKVETVDDLIDLKIKTYSKSRHNSILREGSFII